MRARYLTVVLVLIFVTPLFAKDVYLSVGGSVGVFRTDARIFNPSFDKDITITARYLPSGNIDNSGVATKSITVTKRSMAVYDDVVQSLFGGGAPLGAVRLTSDDDFVAAQRIYADLRTGPQAGTLGQFVPGLDVAAALKKGVLIQLKSGNSTIGPFRTNWGGANPNAVAANVVFKLYDKANTLVDTKNLTLQPFGVVSPANITAFFSTGTRDLTDSWISFESDQPVFLYASVVDNGSTDPTFVPASLDTGVAPPAPQLKTVTISARNWEFTMTQSEPIRAGDRVKLILSRTEGTHGIIFFTPSGGQLLQVGALPGNPTEFEVTFPVAGNYEFVCTNSGCGVGHTDMTGAIMVQ
jgi:plastocyanin